VADSIFACEEWFRSVCEGLPADYEHEDRLYCVRACLVRERVGFKGPKIGFAWGLGGCRRLISRDSFLAFDAHLAKRAL
jgi:hypothetical protein